MKKSEVERPGEREHQHKGREMCGITRDEGYYKAQNHPKDNLGS